METLKKVLRNQGWTIYDNGDSFDIQKVSPLGEEFTITISNNLQEATKMIKDLNEQLSWQSGEISMVNVFMEAINMNMTESKVTEAIEDKEDDSEFQEYEEQEEERITEYTILFKSGTELYKQYEGEFITEDKDEAEDLIQELENENKMDQVEQYFSKDWVRYYDPFDEDYTEWEEDTVQIYYE